MKQKAHRLRALGMVTGRAHRAEAVLDLALHDEVGGEHACTGRAQGRLHGTRAHRRIRVEVADAVLGHVLEQGVYVVPGVNALDVFALRFGRIVERDVHVQPRGDQAIIDRR